MIIVVAWMLLLVLSSIQAEEPFTTRNVRRIITIALIVGLCRTLVRLPQHFPDYWISSRGRLSHTSTIIFRGTFTPGSPVNMVVILLVDGALSRGLWRRHTLWDRSKCQSADSTASPVTSTTFPGAHDDVERPSRRRGASHWSTSTS